MIVRGLVLCALLAGAASCAADTPVQSVDATDALDAEPPSDAATDGRDAGSDSDTASNLLRDAAPPDMGFMQTEPPFSIPTCEGAPDETCCRSAIGFEDQSTDHFLAPTCCTLGLSNPVSVTTPTACGRGALRLDAQFLATSPASLCDTVDADSACAYRTGEVSRAVLTSLNVTGLTMSAAVYMQGPPLPDGPVYAQLFILGKTGFVDGPQTLITTRDVWTAIEFPIADNGTETGADIRLIGVRIRFGGQAWTGRVYLDEISWL